MTHFALSSYEQALRLPTFFPISGLARLGVKPSFCRSSWRAFASTHPLMLSSASPREVLFAYPPSPPWNLASFTLESTFFFPCSRSDSPLSRQGAALTHLDSLPPHDLVIWTDGSVTFPFGKSGSGVFSNYSLCGTEATFSLSVRPICSSFSAEAYAILQALCWSRQHQQVRHFSFLILSDPRHFVFSSVFPFTPISGRSCLLFLPVLLGYNGSPDTRFSQRTTQLMSRPDGERYSSPLQPRVVSVLLFLVSTLLFSRIASVLSRRNSSTHRFPRFPLRNLCSLVTLAVPSLIFAATDTAIYLALISLKLAELRNLPTAPADTHPRTPLISFCTVQLRILCAPRSLATLCLSTTSVPGPGKLPGLWCSKVFHHAPIPRKGSGNNNNNMTF